MVWYALQVNYVRYSNKPETTLDLHSTSLDTTSLCRTASSQDFTDIKDSRSHRLVGGFSDFIKDSDCYFTRLSQFIVEGKDFDPFGRQVVLDDLCLTQDFGLASLFSSDLCDNGKGITGTYIIITIICSREEKRRDVSMVW